jgi:two-component system chemotaxis response regulator CheY
MRFLVVDDSITMRRLIVGALNQMGFDQVDQAGNGRDGLALLEHAPVDLIITDCTMPGMSGVDFVRTVRQGAATRRIPVLMVSTSASRQDIVNARNAGVTGYVVKPFTPELIREKVEALLAR